MGRELESKYRATAAQIAAIREKYEDFSSISMETSYYDTPSLRLNSLRWTLRRRLENGRSVCTVKTPAPGGARGEWERECPSIEEAIPALCALGAPAELADIAREGLILSCGARFTRLAKLLTLEDCSVELALDQGVLLGGGREEAFAEVEVEYKSGNEAAFLAFARLLAAEYGLVPEPASKVQRARARAKS